MPWRQHNLLSHSVGLAGQVTVAACLLGLAVHWRVYPIIYALPIMLWMPTTTNTKSYKVSKAPDALVCILLLTILQVFVHAAFSMYDSLRIIYAHIPMITWVHL